MRILHISDIHLENHNINQVDAVIRELISAIKSCDVNTPIEVVICSGDLVDKFGESFISISHGYELFFRLIISPICEELHVPYSNFLVAPGNHDIDHTCPIEAVCEKSINGFEQSELYSSQKKREKLLLDRHSDFLRLQKNLLESNHNVVYKQYAFLTNVCVPTSIGLLGFTLLNTPLMLINSDNSNIINAIESQDLNLAFQNCCFRMLVAHHKYSAVKELNLPCIRDFVSRFDAYFCGHTHGRMNYMVCYPEAPYVFRAPALLVNTHDFAIKNCLNGFLLLDFYDGVTDIVMSLFLQNLKGKFEHANTCKISPSFL